MTKIIDAYEIWNELAMTHRIYLVREVDGEPDDGTPMPSFARCSPEEVVLYRAAAATGGIETWTGRDGVLGIPNADAAHEAASAIRKVLS